MLKDLDLFHFIEINNSDLILQQFLELRQEYFFLSDIEFLDGRIGFLERLLKKDSIYLTEDFIPYESMVRDNIKQNILKLKNLY